MRGLDIDGTPLHLRVVDDAGEELGTYAITMAEAESQRLFAAVGES